MKKVGIITIHNSPNYGACLQAFALWKYINNKGVDCEIIDLFRPYQKEYITSKKFKPRRIKQENWIKHFLRQVKSLATPQKQQTQYFSKEAKRKFEDFNSLVKYSAPFYGPDLIYKNPPVYDLYISGSDQLWNPTQPYCIEPYFLTFAPKGSKKISFATSIGITELKEDEKSDLKKWLDSYSSISVREKQAKTMLEKLTGKSITQVSDPTFLLEVTDWEEYITSPNIQKPYILLFALHFQADLVEYCIKLCKEANLQLIYLSQIQPSDDRYTSVRDAGPKDFLGYIKNAELVITDSFHCTVFSIILGANNFYTHISNKSRGSRIYDLLDIYELSSHLLDSNLTTTFKEIQSNTINRKRILSIMQEQRNQSRKFLDNELDS